MKKTRRGGRVEEKASVARIRTEVLTNIFKFTETDAAVAAHINRFIVFVDEVIAINIVCFHNVLPVFKHRL